MSEAHCMLGQTQQALELLQLDSLIDSETKFMFESIANNSQENRPQSSTIINLVNQSVVLMCAGQMEAAKVKIDQMLEMQELKVSTIETDSKHLLPSYLVMLLVYFYMKTSNEFS